MLGLLLLLAVGAYLRLYRLQASPIWGDQSILYSIALDWVNWGKFPLAANKSSAGAMNPPLIEYLIALPLFVRKTVMAPLWFQAVLSLTAVPLIYFLAARLFNRTTGLLAAFFLALNPWAVYYSRLIWNPSLVPVFATLLLTAVLLYLTTQRWPWLMMAAAALALTTQLHLSALALLPVLAVVMVLFGRRLWPGDWRRALALVTGAALVFLLLYLPYLMFERAVGFADVKALTGVLTGAQLSTQAHLEGTAVNAAAFFILLDLVTGSHFLANQVNAWQTAVPSLPGLMPLMRLLSVTAVLFAALSPLIWRARHPGERLPPPQVALVVGVVWVALPVLLYVRHSQYLQNYFFLYLLPAAIVLLAALLAWAWALAGHIHYPAGRHVIRWLMVLMLLLWGGWQFAVYHAGLALADDVDLWQRTTAGDIQQAITYLQRLQAANPACSVTLLAEGYQHDSSPVGLVEPFLYPVDVRLAVVGRGFIMPGGCTLYGVTAVDPVAQSLLDRYGTRLAPLMTLQGSWDFYRVDGTSFASAHTAQAVWHNGLELVDWQIDGDWRPGQTVPITLTWRITQAQPPLTDVHFFTHMVDAAGTLAAQDDAAVVHPVYWRHGDFLVAQFAVVLPPDLPPGSYALHTGMYTWPNIERVPLITGETTFVIKQLTMTD